MSLSVIYYKTFIFSGECDKNAPFSGWLPPDFCGDFLIYLSLLPGTGGRWRTPGGRCAGALPPCPAGRDPSEENDRSYLGQLRQLPPKLFDNKSKYFPRVNREDYTFKTRMKYAGGDSLKSAI